MKNGVDIDVAFALDATELMAWTVVFGEMDGAAAFNWDTMEWEERR